MLLRYLLLSVFITGLIACSDGPEVNNADLVIRNGIKYHKTSSEPFTGVGIVENAVRGMRLEITYKNGILHGSSNYYFSDGTLASESVYDNGTAIFQTVFYKSGARQTHTEYTGKNSGLYEAWWENGKRAEISTMQYGQVVPGSQTKWDKFGNEV